MTRSCLYIHPIQPERKVRAGFGWSAFLFGTLWAYSEGLVAHAGRLAAIDAVTALLLTLDAGLKLPWLVCIAVALFVAKNIYCGLRANHWLSCALARRGYRPLS
ncbi:hypothetical protein [Ralstonia syzygii]|uniref:Transmembrane protein n=1 Tax=Ralstonia syzygii R24 TaxID=907261 RepID=G3A3G9_9RALS|nr:hypothetical protein [Ralstonia syzygii]CCA88413.1 conserved hypothetical protein [Ralstonia syzygii R24]